MEVDTRDPEGEAALSWVTLDIEDNGLDIEDNGLDALESEGSIILRKRNASFSMAHSDDPKLDRKSFFSEGMRWVSESAVEAASAFVDQGSGAAQLVVFVRPPGAVDEAAFAARCTGCLDCVKACHQGVILFDRGDPSRLPYLDLAGHKPCFLCNSLPCIAACDTAALRLPDGNHSSANPDSTGVSDAPSQVRLARLDVLVERCLAYSGALCTACLSSCPFPGRALFFDEDDHPVIVHGRCTGCALCLHACVARPKALGVS